MIHALITLGEIEAIADLWPRFSLDTDRVAQFAALYRDEGLTALPPVEVVPIGGNHYLLVDGWHRVSALQTCGLKEVQAIVSSPGALSPEEFVFRRGLETCTTAALPLNRNERRAAVEHLLRHDPSMTDVAVARLAGVSHQTVGRVRQRLSNGQPPIDPDGTIERTNGPEVCLTPHDVARYMADGLMELWESRGPGMAVGWWETAALGDHLGRAFVEMVGADEATVWTERFVTWAKRAHQVASDHANEAQ